MCFSHTADEAKFEDKAESKDINGNFLNCYFIFFFSIFLGMFLPTWRLPYFLQYSQAFVFQLEKFHAHFMTRIFDNLSQTTLSQILRH